MFDKIVATNRAAVLRNDLQNKLDIGWQYNVLITSLVYEVAQNLISRLSDHHKVLGITQIRVGINPLVIGYQNASA
jgi:hypothetical protein